MEAGHVGFSSDEVSDDLTSPRTTGRPKIIGRGGAGASLPRDCGKRNR